MKYKRDENEIQLDSGNTSTERIKYIDGIKGFACITVIVAHFLQVFYPTMLTNQQPVTVLEKIILLTPLNIFINGNFGVHCFFVLTGFLICNKITNGKKASSPGKLYINMLKLIIPSVLLAFFLMRMDFMFHLKSGAFSSVQNYNKFEPHFLDCIYDIFIRTFLRTSEYVGPLWTISYSYFGSLIAYAAIYYSKQLNDGYKIVLYLLFSLILYRLNPQMISFVLGGMAYECSRYYRGCNAKWLKVLLIILGIYLAFINRWCNGIYLPFKSLLRFYARYDSIIRSVGICILLVVIDNSIFMKKLFSKSGISKVGRISMYCYSFHWPIILSLGCGIFIKFGGISSPNILKFFILIIIAIVTFLLSLTVLKIEEQITQYIKKIRSL